MLEVWCVICGRRLAQAVFSELREFDVVLVDELFLLLNFKVESCFNDLITVAVSWLRFNEFVNADLVRRILTNLRSQLPI